MALNNPSITDQVVSTKIDKVADTDADYAAAAINTVIYNLQTKETVKKDASSNIVKIFSPFFAFQFAASDETTALAAATDLITVRSPKAFNCTGVRISLSTAQAAGTIFTVDIHKNGVTILSTKLTIDNTEKTSETAATAAVISVAAIADDDEITVDIDQIGDGTAAGLKITMLES